jgi:hypothetical protein
MNPEANAKKLPKAREEVSWETLPRKLTKIYCWELDSEY